MNAARAAAVARLFARPIAHRGLHGCGRGGPIENSLGAAEAAIAAGYGIECDVHLSRDGVPMVFHDETLDRLTGQPGALSSLTAAELSALALGDTDDTIPRLVDFLKAVGGRTPVVIEVKRRADADMTLVDETLAGLAQYDGVVAVESFDPRVVLRLAERRAHRPVGLVGPDDNGAPPDADVLAACDFVSWHVESLDAIARAAPALPRSTWTVRSPAQVGLARRAAAQIVFEGFLPATND